MNRPYRVAAAILCTTCFLPGPAHALTEGEPLSMVFTPSPAPTDRSDGSPVMTQQPLAPSCTLYLPKIEDTRSNKANAGNLTLMLPTVHATPRSVQSLRSGDGIAWTRGALQSMNRYGFQTVLGAPAPTPAGARQVTADVALRLAHAWSTDLNLVSHVVLQVSYRMPGGEPVSRQYHGMGTGTNWVNGNGEFMSVLNLGLEEAVRSMASDAALLCDGKPLPAPVAAL
ncbi:hypothetical protein [Variovorax sp. PAMC26660]|uniref:hypothetical protein n=1 Tax=Variovorax sp. PAMC26660 TaxID=2762322 RepID=UPI00164E2FC9|nr:hypothetical protein [Variovorax sp. PAMC26660]QNK69909.1 hypothetical protein H7F35_09565 [Variovorax sp. PAMC26660]